MENYRQQSIRSLRDRRYRSSSRNLLHRHDSVATFSSHDDSAPVLLKQQARRPSMFAESSLDASHKSTRWRKTRKSTKIFDDLSVVAGYAAVPLLDIDHLPRGGISFETTSVGRIQFGMPPETIKDSMVLGLAVPNIYIVPAERFCREQGPSLGINISEIEFPAFFNFFCLVKRCKLIVDSPECEENIRQVFSESIFGPAQFRNHSKPKANEDEDFHPSFPKNARPDFYKEFNHFRTAEEATNFEEMTIDTLLDFRHFDNNSRSSFSTSGTTGHDRLGMPPEITPEEFLDTGDTFLNDIRERQESRRHLMSGSSCKDSKEDEFEEEIRDLRRTYSDPDLPGSNQSELDGVIYPKRASCTSRGGSVSSKDFQPAIEEDEPEESQDLYNKGSSASWTYSQAKWLGTVATVYPSSASEADKQSVMTARVEIFKMPGGLEYIVHDINNENEIIGKVRFSGTVHVPKSITVIGFKTATPGKLTDIDSEHSIGDSDSEINSIPASVEPPTFHPPSFGVTVLGNGHGFEKNGSTSGYVLWINGRGVMIDPPPYSTATLEVEGIRPQMIIAILLTHCHADHDAGAFQKLLAGSRVAVITTPTIYNSFIRKYAALSGLSPALLRHCHRHRAAVIGQPLSFQGGLFHFTYTLHTIPCISFRVQWRDRSIVFTGDHLNNPEVIDRLQEKGVLSPERANSLREMPLQECDLLLHESGAPPIHTPLEVLRNLPEHIKKRLYVVHTSALPEGCELRVAPIGTQGTLRLDMGPQIQTKEEIQYNMYDSNAPIRTLTGGVSVSSIFSKSKENGILKRPFQGLVKRLGIYNDSNNELKDMNSGTTSVNQGPIDGSSDSDESSICAEVDTFGWDRRGTGKKDPQTVLKKSKEKREIGKPKGKLSKAMYSSRSLSSRYDKPCSKNDPPLVQFRPTCVSDSWFILNLLSNIPFLSSLAYEKTMEVLETAVVKFFSKAEVVIEAAERPDMLCVVWEGTCMEKYDKRASKPVSRKCSQSASNGYEDSSSGDKPAIWHAGDWTAPLSLQPDPHLSADCSTHINADVVAISPQGVKVILVYMKDLEAILKFSPLYRQYVASNRVVNDAGPFRSKGSVSSINSIQRTHFLEIINCNSVFRTLTASQKRHLQSLVEGPKFYQAGQILWQVGMGVDFAFIIISGTSTFTSKHKRNRRMSTGYMSTGTMTNIVTSRLSNVGEQIQDKIIFCGHRNSEYSRLEAGLRRRVLEVGDDDSEKFYATKQEQEEQEAQNAHALFYNKVLARLYARRAYTSGLVFSRGSFLSDTTRMMTGSLSAHELNDDSDSEEDEKYYVHSTNLVAGPKGCLVMQFPRGKLIDFLSAYPGVLLGILGTQVVV